LKTEINKYELWFLTGSQHLYGDNTLRQVESNSLEISTYLESQSDIIITIKFKAVLTSAESIHKMIKDANHNDNCIGIICWMHTFSPAKMWINGLKILHKPLLHLHTQFNRDIPWSTLDMNFMNLNQSAHGGREFGFICNRMQIKRKVVVGHWTDSVIIQKISNWSRAALGWADSQQMKIARFGDNMREVAVTEGNKVSAQIQFGYSVNGFGLGDLVEHIKLASDTAISELVTAYEDMYILMPSLLKNGTQRSSLIEAAKIEIGMRSFLEAGGFTAFTTTFENLHGITQLPGLAVQRLMSAGYGFAAEGDWKIAALVRTIKCMAAGLPGGNSFMEDYTYHFSNDGDSVLGAHMLEICPSISNNQVRCEVHPLGIGGKEDPVRLIFNAAHGPALNASMIDGGDHFRLLVNEVEAQTIDYQMPKLPVARVLWKPLPNLHTATEAWITAGGAHHTCYSQNISTEILQDFAEIASVEIVVIR